MISIIITSFNCGEYLKECVESVKNQTYRDLEIIIVDDGSTDETTRKRLVAIEQEEDIKVIRQDNAGVSKARNVGVQHAHGKYIVFLDGDDKLTEQYIEKMIKAKEQNPESEIVYTYTKMFGEKKYARPLEKPNYKRLLIYNHSFVVTCLLDKKRIMDIGGFNEEMLYGLEDWEFFVRYCKPGMEVSRVNSLDFLYRIKKGSRTYKIGESAKKTLLMKLTIVNNNIDTYVSNLDSLEKYTLVKYNKHDIKMIAFKIKNYIFIVLNLLFRKNYIQKIIM